MTPEQALAAAAEEPAFVIELEQFQGPLDLLLHLIRAQDIDIFDIPIAQITAQFLAIVSRPGVLALDQAGEFLEMAAVLIRIKSQMLLPRRTEGGLEGEDPRAELVRRLLEYEHFREIARRLEASESERVRHFRRGFFPPRAEPERPEETEPPPLEVTWEEVWAAALDVGGRYRPIVEHRVRRRPVSIDDKIVLVLKEVGERARVEFSRLVAPFQDKLHAVATLLAGLELSKRRQVALRQREPFAPLWILRRHGNGIDADQPAD